MSQFSTATRLMLLMHAGDPTFARTCNSNLPIKYELLITNQIRIDEDKCEEELLAICCVFFSGGFVSVVLSHVGRCFCILWLHTFFFSFSPSAVITNFKFILFFLFYVTVQRGLKVQSPCRLPQGVLSIYIYDNCTNGRFSMVMNSALRNRNVKKKDKRDNVNLYWHFEANMSDSKVSRTDKIPRNCGNKCKCVLHIKTARTHIFLFTKFS